MHTIVGDVMNASGMQSPSPEKKQSQSAKGPKVVEISYCVNSVSNIDAKSNSYEVDIEVDFFWNEPKCIGKVEGEVVDLKKSGMFDPQIYVTNQAELEKHKYVTSVLDPATGDVVTRVRYRGKCYITNMNLSYFPFDCQNLQVGLRTTRLEIEKVVLRARNDSCSLHHHGVHEWVVLDHLMKDFVTDPALSSAHKEYSIMFITILVRRQSMWFINNIFITSTLLVIFTWATYLYEPHAHREKMYVIFGSILSMLENKFAVGNTLPKTQHRTLVDIYVDVSYFCVLFSTISAFLTRFVEEEEGLALAEEVNWILFVINAGIMVLVIAYVCYAESMVEGGIQDWLEYANAKRTASQEPSSRTTNENISSLRTRRGSILDVGGGRKSGASVSVTTQLNRAAIGKAVSDAKMKLAMRGLPDSPSKVLNSPNMSLKEWQNVQREVARDIIVAAMRAHSFKRTRTDHSGRSGKPAIKPSISTKPVSVKFWNSTKTSSAVYPTQS